MWSSSFDLRKGSIQSCWAIGPEQHSRRTMAVCFRADRGRHHTENMPLGHQGNTCCFPLTLDEKQMTHGDASIIAFSPEVLSDEGKQDQASSR